MGQKHAKKFRSFIKITFQTGTIERKNFEYNSHHPPFPSFIDHYRTEANHVLHLHCHEMDATIRAIA